MNKFILVGLLMLVGLLSKSQPVVNRSSNVVTVVDGRLGAGLNLLVPRYADTSAANSGTNLGVDTAGTIIYTYDVKSFWLREHSPKRWVKILKTGEGSLWELNGNNNLVPKTFSGNQVQITNKSFLLTGATGSIPTTATGTHLFWYPAKQAFRAGQSFGTEWSDANIGQYSFAFGEVAEANKFGSIAIGSGVHATGTSSIAIGNGATASATGSVSLGGSGNVAMSENSFATGESTVARAHHSFTTGTSTTTNTTELIPQVSIGKLNDTIQAGELFRIGWITEGAGIVRNNVFSVDTLGRVKIGKLDTGGSSDSVIVWSATDSMAKKVAQSSIGGGGDTSLVTNIRDFGAVGDGATDNTIAINAAIQAATTNGKPIVYFPTGVWGMRSAYRDTAVVYQPTGIKVESNITLIGAGQGNSVIKILPPPASSTFSAVSAPVNYTTNTSFNHIIWGNNVSNVVIRDLSIHGNLANQINYNVNPYLTPQDSTHTDSCETDAIKFWFGSNNKVINVRIDSVAGYGVGFFASTNGLVSNCVITTSVNGAVYFKRYSDGGAVLNSYITNNHCDNIRIRSNNILVQGNEISWTKFNPNIAQANFAGIYVESDSSSNLMPPSIIGVKLLNNYLHDNSSYGIDCFNRDTLIYTAQGYSVLIANNTISYNANSGVTLHMPMMEIRNNQILENGANSLGQQDPVTYRGAGVAANSSGVACVISGNSFRDTRGFQDYAIGGAAGDYPRMLQVTNNVAQGGLGFTQAISNAYDNPFFGNSWLASAAASVQSDFFQRQLTGNLLLSPPSNGVDFGNGTANFYSALRHGATQEAMFVGQRTGTNLMGFGVSDRAIYAASGSGTNAGRDWRVYDFVTAASRMGVNADGEFYVGANQTTYSLRARQRGINNHNTGQVYIPSAGTGSTVNEVQAGLFVEMGAGYTGSGTHPAIRATNAAVQTGNNSGGAGTFRGALAFYGGSTGASTAGVGAGGLFFSTGSNTNLGVIADATVAQRNDAGARSIGLEALARKTHASAVQIGAYVGLNNSQPTYASGALVVDNADQIDPVQLWRDNGTVIAGMYDGGEMRIGSAVDQGTFTFQNTGGLYQIGSISLNSIPTGTASMSILLHHNDSLVYQIPASTFPTQSALNDTAAAIREYIGEYTATIATTGGGGTQIIDIALPEDSSGEVELIVVGVGGTTLGSFQDRRFVMFQNETGSAPTIDATSFTMNSGSPVRLNGMDVSAAVGHSVNGENLRLTFTASTTEDVAWKVYYKIRSHTFPL